MRSGLLILFCALVTAQAQTYDVIISGGRIIDGTGNAWFYGDLAIRGDRIARIAPPGMLRGAAAKQRIDAKGMVVSPGFIDIQGQSRGPLLQGDGRLISKSRRASPPKSWAKAAPTRPRMRERSPQRPMTRRAG